MGRVKAMIMDQEEKLNEYVWYIVSECETFQEFSFKVKLFAETEIYKLFEIRSLKENFRKAN